MPDYSGSKPEKKSKSVKIKSTELQSRKKFPVVGIGASAGGLEALTILFDHLPSDTGMAFVIVQHTDPTYKSLLSELIGRHTKMPVAEITNASTIQPNSVYIIPSNKDVRLHNSIFRLTTPKLARAKRRPVDIFFHSLAEDQQEFAIGIVLSGNGTEGTLGLIEIKAAGGMAIVQDPATAQFGGMPENAILSGSPDYILAPDKIPSKLNNYNKKRIKPATLKKEMLGPSERQLDKILAVIKSRTGHDFTEYKPNTIIRRIIKRIALHKTGSVEAYIGVMEKKPEEAIELYNDFLIGVTSFFRDKDVFNYLEKKVLPGLLESAEEKKEIRVWVCGCSTGEEAYSFAMLFREMLLKLKLDTKVTIFASDLDKEAIVFARKAVYPATIANAVSAERINKFFNKKDSAYHLCKEVRDMVVFAHHNVINDPPFSKMDLISCRNLLIYINSDLQKKIIQHFYYSLNDSGLLVLGLSENIANPAGLFLTVDEKLRIFKKKAGFSRKINPVYDLSFVKQAKDTTHKAPIELSMKKLNISGITEKILLDQYAPPSVIIDKYNEAIYFSGNTGIYLEPPPGIARFDILEMARNGLKHSLEEAIKKARKTNSEVETKNIEVLLEDQYRITRLKVKPLLSKEYEPGTLMIIFEPVNKPGKPNKENKNSVEKEKLKLSLLEKELKMTRQHLQIAINELETSLDDFKCSNEELQSSNEELETSREELQAVNEELVTVNAELNGKLDELSESNNDLTNLLRCIEVATLYLTKDLLIKRFTPAATKIFNLISTDIDRPVTQLSANLEYNSLVTDVKQVLKTLQVKSIQVKDLNGLWYYMRIIPYRTSENIIEGVLVTLVEITSQKTVELELKKSNEYLNLIMENLPVIPYTALLKPKLKMDFIGKTVERVTGFLPEKFSGSISFWSGRIHPDDKKSTLASLEDHSKKGSRNQPFRWKCADGKYKSFIISKQFIPEAEGRSAYLVGVWQETPKIID